MRARFQLVFANTTALRYENSPGLWPRACWISCLRSWVVIGSFRARKGRRPGGAPRRTHLRQSPVEVPSKSRRVQESKKKRSRKRHRISNGFWTPKCSQKPPKMNPKCHKNPLFVSLRFHPVFFLIFGCVLACFDRRPTRALIGIYSKFVGCSIFRKA